MRHEQLRDRTDDAQRSPAATPFNLLTALLRAGPDILGGLASLSRLAPPSDPFAAQARCPLNL
jgi:hypothetical protein